MSMFTAPPCCHKHHIAAEDYPGYATIMILCSECGNKRCPKATDCSLGCTHSNEPGQPGSRYT